MFSKHYAQHDAFAVCCRVRFFARCASCVDCLSYVRCFLAGVLCRWCSYFCFHFLAMAYDAAMAQQLRDMAFEEGARSAKISSNCGNHLYNNCAVVLMGGTISLWSSLSSIVVSFFLILSHYFRRRIELTEQPIVKTLHARVDFPEGIARSIQIILL